MLVTFGCAVRMFVEGELVLLYWVFWQVLMIGEARFGDESVMVCPCPSRVRGLLATVTSFGAVPKRSLTLFIINSCSFCHFFFHS